MLQVPTLTHMEFESAPVQVGEYWLQHRFLKARLPVGAPGQIYSFRFSILRNEYHWVASLARADLPCILSQHSLGVRQPADQVAQPKTHRQRYQRGQDELEQRVNGQGDRQQGRQSDHRLVDQVDGVGVA